MEQILMNQCCRLFLDTEDSISTEPSVTIPYSGQTEFVFPLDGSQEVSRLRWKPLNECVVLKLAAFEVTTERDGTVTLKPSETNALAIVGETYYFAAHDPQMVFDLSGLTGGVVLSARANVEFLQTSTKALEATLTVLSTGNQELVHRLLTAEQRVMDLERENRGLDELLLDAQYRVIQIETSKIWRWTAPLRAMAKLVGAL